MNPMRNNETLMKTTDERLRRLGFDARDVRRMIRNGMLEAVDMNPEGARRVWRVPLSEYERLKKEWAGRQS